MADDEKVVYLQDIEPLPKSAPAVAATSSKPTGGVKRQRTLLDVFSGSQEKKAAEPAAKKIKITASGTSSNKTSTMALGQRLNSIPFSLSSYLESLTEEQKSLLKLECEAIGKSWLKLLKDEIKKPYFISLKRFLLEEGVRGVDDTPKSVKVYPSPNNIYAWSNTPLGKVKVVILGQDPYHGVGQAHGLCFSVPPGVAVPPSLRNIYAELKAEYPAFEPPKHGNLTAWATNGVLMLNTCLTVRAGNAGSHSNKGWEQFTDKVVDVVDRYGGANIPGLMGNASDGNNTGLGRGVVFLAWGSWAAKRVAKLDKNKHLILTSPHPSPLSAHRGFLGNNHFKTANQWLKQKYGAEGEVDWCCLDAELAPDQAKS